MKNTLKSIEVLLLSIVLIGFNTNANAQNKSLKTNKGSTILIAKVKDGKASFVVDQNTLLKDWQKFISKQNNSKICRLNKAKVISKNNDTEFYLTATGIVGNLGMKFTISLKQISPKCLVLMGQTIQCSSTNCDDIEEGCFPKGTMCSPCSNAGDCKKTITSSPVEIFPSLTPSVCE
jgi:hypothetical protein